MLAVQAYRPELRTHVKSMWAWSPAFNLSPQNTEMGGPRVIWLARLVKMASSGIGSFAFLEINLKSTWNHLTQNIVWLRQ